VWLREREELAARNAQADDSSCQSYGAAPGSSAYFTCRMTKDETHIYINELRREQAIAGFNRGMENMERASMGQPPL
jgi:hypothetical protein